MKTYRVTGKRYETGATIQVTIVAGDEIAAAAIFSTVHKASAYFVEEVGLN